jgi:hypothetical protein
MKVVLGLLIALFLLQSALAQTDQRLLRPTDRAGAPRSERDPTVIRSQNVLVNVQLLRGQKNSRLIVPLMDGTRLNIVRDRQEQAPKNGLIWYGKVADEPRSSVVLSLKGEALIGNIRTQRGKIYHIRYLGEGVHSLSEVDQSKFPQEAQPIKPDIRPPQTEAPADTCGTDPPTDIDVMVVYTDDARIAAGGTDAIEASIFLAVAETNQSYIDSNIFQRIRLVHMVEVTYTETGSSSTDLTALRNGSGVFNNVPVLRNTFAADVVVMIVNSFDACGRGYMMQSVSNSFESNAYSVVMLSCATGYYSFGHELGHNMGADHDCPNATSTGPYAYNRGYSDTSPTSPATPWRTIMSYQTSPVSTRVPYWSNPGVNYPIPGVDPMGGMCAGNSTDNHLVLNNTALTVANFRCTSPGVTNVWAKDTWNDTGKEPDPSTAAEDMWISPYIWVRNSQDTNLTHQHQHQNPEFGSTNWVYVKWHNGGGATTGNVELYWANASTGLSWQTNWNLLTSIPVSSFAANSTKIVEAPWNSLPGTGHYCMVARWVSGSDPMTNPETTDINGNVRNNNNIVWRNLNIVDLAPDPAEDVNFIVRNTGRERTTISLAIRPPKNELQNSFMRYGQVIIRFDNALMKAWRLGGNKGKGFRSFGSGIVITDPNGAVFENFVVNREFVGKVNLTFKRLPTTPRRSFIIDVAQFSPQRVSTNTARYSSKVTGGISYEIHTDIIDRERK